MTERTVIAVAVTPDLARAIDELRERELLSRSSWIRREIVQAVRASSLEAAEATGTA
jgi:metal-responsive CopG/Arc/MetJ family transcriptional regulator